MVVRFTMKNDEASVACAISTDAMDAAGRLLPDAAGKARAAIFTAAETGSKRVQRKNSAPWSWRATLPA